MWIFCDFQLFCAFFSRNYESVFVNSLGGYLPKLLVAVEVGGQVSFRKIDVAPSTTNTLWHCHSSNWKTKNARAKYPNLYLFGISMYETLKLPQVGGRHHSQDHLLAGQHPSSNRPQTWKSYKEVSLPTNRQLLGSKWRIEANTAVA